MNGQHESAAAYLFGDINVLASSVVDVVQSGVVHFGVQLLQNQHIGRCARVGCARLLPVICLSTNAT